MKLPWIGLEWFLCTWCRSHGFSCTENARRRVAWRRGSGVQLNACTVNPVLYYRVPPVAANFELLWVRSRKKKKEKRRKKEKKEITIALSFKAILPWVSFGWGLDNFRGHSSSVLWEWATPVAKNKYKTVLDGPSHHNYVVDSGEHIGPEITKVLIKI